MNRNLLKIIFLFAFLDAPFPSIAETNESEDCDFTTAKSIFWMNLPSSQAKPQQSTSASHIKRTANRFKCTQVPSFQSTSVTFLSPPHTGLKFWLETWEENSNSFQLTSRTSFKNRERIKINFRANTDGYLYVINVDDKATPILLFPDQAENPFLQAGKQVDFEVYFAERTSPTEQLFALFSKIRINDPRYIASNLKSNALHGSYANGQFGIQLTNFAGDVSLPKTIKRYYEERKGIDNTGVLMYAVVQDVEMGSRPIMALIMNLIHDN